MSVVKISKDNFNAVKGQDKPVLLDFYADWCGPCKMVLPIIDEIGAERSDILVGKVNVDASPDLASEFGIYSVPTLVVLKDGRVHRKVSGARPKAAILSLINE